MKHFERSELIKIANKFFDERKSKIQKTIWAIIFNIISPLGKHIVVTIENTATACQIELLSREHRYWRCEYRKNEIFNSRKSLATAYVKLNDSRLETM